VRLNQYMDISIIFDLMSEYTSIIHGKPYALFLDFHHLWGKYRNLPVHIFCNQIIHKKL